MRREGLGLIWGELGCAALLEACLLAAALAPAGGGPAGATNVWRFDPRPRAGAAEGRCAYDLSRGPVRVTVEPWGGPFSVAVREAGGPRLFAADRAGAPEGVDLVIALNGQAAPRGARTVISTSRAGEVVQRRAAANAERFAAADRARRGDVCGPVGLDFPAPR